MIELDLLDQSFAHCEYSNNPLPPVQVADEIRWNRTLNSGSKYIFATDWQIPNLVRYPKERRIAWLLEPKALIPLIYDMVLNNASEFEFILSHDCQFFASVPNFRWVPFGGCWIPKSEWQEERDFKDSYGASIIASSKSMLEGHKLRHHIINKFKNAEFASPGYNFKIYGHGYSSIESKLEAAYPYQIIIENDSRRGYFTEKLIDCILSGSVPIYWGCKNLEDYGFNLDGMLYCQSKEELEQKVTDLFNLKGDELAIYPKARHQNFIQAQQYILAENYISTHLRYLLDRA